MRADQRYFGLWAALHSAYKHQRFSHNSHAQITRESKKKTAGLSACPAPVIVKRRQTHPDTVRLTHAFVLEASLMSTRSWHRIMCWLKEVQLSATIPDCGHSGSNVKTGCIHNIWYIYIYNWLARSFSKVLCEMKGEWSLNVFIFRPDLFFYYFVLICKTFERKGDLISFYHEDGYMFVV